MRAVQLVMKRRSGTRTVRNSSSPNSAKGIPTTGASTASNAAVPETSSRTRSVMPCRLAVLISKTLPSPSATRRFGNADMFGSAKNSATSPLVSAASSAGSRPTTCSIGSPT